MSFRPHISLLLAALAVVVALPSTASGAVNGFEGADGNQVCDALVDWACLPDGRTAVSTSDGSAGNDDVFANGKENAPGSWTFKSGGTNGKTDLKRVYADESETTESSFLNVAFVREEGEGQGFVSFELAQRRSTWTNAASTTIPCRTDGDVMVSYEIGSTGASVSLKVYRWDGSGGPISCPDGANGSWLGGSAPANSEGAINDEGAIADPLGGSDGLDPSTFGEAALDLSAVAKQAGITKPCEYFRALQAHSRQSESDSAGLGDFVATTPINVVACVPPDTGGGDTTPPDAPTATATATCADNGTVAISGTAEAGSQVQVKEGSETVGLATADSSGAWALEALTGVSDGKHTYVARARDAASNVSGNTTFEVTLACATGGGKDPVVVTPVGTGTGSGGGGGASVQAAVANIAASLNQQASRRCSTKPFSVGIPAKGVKSVVFSIDGKRVATVKKGKGKQVALRIDPSLYRQGDHKISARVTPTRGRARTVPLRSFTTCSLGKCVSRRAFKIRVKKVKGGDKVVKATVLVNGKKVKVVRGRRLTAPVTLTGLPKGQFKVQVVSKTRKGKTVKDTRTYRTCEPKKTS